MPSKLTAPKVPKARKGETPSAYLDRVLGGKTAPDIAAWLEARGVKGRRIDPWSCPVTRLLDKAGYHDVGAGLTQLLQVLPDSLRVKFAWDTPTNVAEFMCMFDRTEFPQLVEA